MPTMKLQARKDVARVHLFLCLVVCPSASQSACLTACLSASLHAWPTVCLEVCARVRVLSRIYA